MTMRCPAAKVAEWVTWQLLMKGEKINLGFVMFVDIQIFLVLARIFLPFIGTQDLFEKRVDIH